MGLKKNFKLVKQLLSAKNAILITYAPEKKYWTFQHEGDDEIFAKCFKRVVDTLPDYKQKLEAEVAEKTKEVKAKPGRYSRKYSE